MGSLAVLASGVIGWQITKWYMGVKNAKVSQLPPCSRPLRLRTKSWRGVAWRIVAVAWCGGSVWRGGAVARWCGVAWCGAASLTPVGPRWQEFSERMNEKMPKVSAEVNTSLIGQKLHGVNQESRDKISEDPGQ